MRFNNIIFSNPNINEKHSAWIEHIPFAFFLIDILKPKTFIELGTHNGNSYFSFCQAIKLSNLNTNAYAIDLWTGDEHSGYYGIDVFEYVSKVNNENFSHFSNLLKLSFDDALTFFDDGIIDLLHIDGMHTYESVKHDFESWLPKMSEKGVIIFHDTQVRERGFGVWKLMEEIKGKYPSMEFEHGFGLGVVCVGNKVDNDFIKFIKEAKNNQFVKNLFANLGEKILIQQKNEFLVQQIQQEQNKVKSIINNQEKETEQLKIKIEQLNIEIKKLQTLQLENEKLSIKIGELQNSQLENEELIIKEKEFSKNLRNEKQALQSLLKQKSIIINKSVKSHEKTKKDVVNLKQQINILNSTIINLTKSKSWQLTKPLRLLKNNRLKRKIILSKNIRLVKSSGFFDKEFYLKSNEDVKLSGDDALKHFILHGGFEGRNPGTEFDTDYYNSHNPDVVASGLNPLVHYILYGRYDGRKTKQDQNHTPKQQDKEKKSSIISSLISKEKQDIDLIKESNYFDAEYYLSVYNDVKNSGINPARHYYHYGWKEGRNPSSKFDTTFYLKSNNDVKQLNTNPLLHFLKYGKSEGRAVLSNKTESSEEKQKEPKLFHNLKISSHSILFISHDAHRAGAEHLLLHLLSWFTEHTSFNIKIICIEGGVLLQRFRSLGQTLVWNKFAAEFPNEIERKEELLKFCGKIDLIYGNTVLAPSIYNELGYLKAPMITHIHELEKSIKKYIDSSTLEKMYNNTDTYIACSKPVEENMVKNHNIPLEKMRCVNEFIRPIFMDLPDQVTQKTIYNLPEDKVIIWGCGTIYWRKGSDIFIETAKKLKEKGVKNFVFYWNGNNHWNSENKEWGEWNKWEKYIENNELKDYIVFIDEENPRNYFASGDIFFLPSREDPFPLVCLEAAECNLPIVCFDDAGGIPGFVEEDAGFVVPFLNIDKAADAIENLIVNKTIRVEKGRNARRKLFKLHTDDVTVPQILQICHSAMKSNPLVSVIVPVYNHEVYLKKRIDSILNQSFRDFEIIILDDASTDNSYEIAKSYEWHPAIKVIKNENNSGSPFKQWEKGLTLASGEIIWFAEGDDFCKPDFLQKLLPGFNNSNVALSYSNSFIVDEKDNISGDYTNYYEKLDFNHWKYSYQVTGLQEINFGLGVKNSVPNASAVLIRKNCIHKTILDETSQFKFSGDWYFYLQIINGKDISYCAENLNYHRKHKQTVTSKFNSDKSSTQLLLTEAASIHLSVLDNYKIYPYFFEKWVIYIEEQILALFPNTRKEHFNNYYPYDSIKEKIANAIRQSKKNKRLVFLTTNDGSSNGGSEQLWRQAAIECRKQGFEVLVVIKKWFPEPFFIKDLSNIGIKILFKEQNQYDKVAEFKPDLMAISIGDQDEGIDWYEYCGKYKIPYVIINQLTKEPNYWPINKSNTNRLISGYLGAETVFFTGNNNRKVMEKRLKCTIPNSSVFYNPLDVNITTSTAFPSVENGLEIAILGNLLRIHKGQHLAIDIFSQEKWQKRKIHLNIYGTGRDETILKELVEKYGLNNVTFHGHVSDILKVWENNHAIFLPSFMEGLPLALVGAMLCGRVPILTDIGAHSEVVTDNINGFVAKEPTVNSLDDALERAFSTSQSWEEIGKKARQKILQYLPEDPIEHFIKQLIIFVK